MTTIPRSRHGLRAVPQSPPAMSAPIVMPSTLRRYPDSVGARIVGESMMPTLRNGDSALVDVSARNPRSGEIVVVFFNDGPLRGRVVGRYQRDDRGEAWLTKDNPAFRQLPLRPGKHTILGTVRCILGRPDVAELHFYGTTTGAKNIEQLPTEEVEARMTRAADVFVRLQREAQGVAAGGGR